MHLRATRSSTRRPRRPHRGGDRRPCRDPDRRATTRRSPQQDAGNRHAAEGRHAALHVAVHGLRAVLADARRTPGRAGDCASSRSSSSANCRRTSTATRMSFRRGVSCYPSLGDIRLPRLAPTSSRRPMPAMPKSAIRVGHIAQDPAIPAMIKIDEMLGKHFAILGTTGTGKSCTVALILRRILEKNPQAPCAAARRPPRICPRLQGHGGGHQPGQHEPAVLAAELRGDRRDPHRPAAQPRDRRRGAARADPHRQARAT